MYAQHEGTVCAECYFLSNSVYLITLSVIPLDKNMPPYSSSLCLRNIYRLKECKDLVYLIIISRRNVYNERHTVDCKEPPRSRQARTVKLLPKTGEQPITQSSTFWSFIQAKLRKYGTTKDASDGIDYHWKVLANS